MSARAARGGAQRPVSRPSPYPAGRDYGYANARIRGLRAQLLPSAFFDELAASADIAAAIRRLEETAYAPDLTRHLLHGRTAIAVDDALRENMTRTYRHVREVSTDEGRHLLDVVFGHWDVFNVKTILRGKHLGLAAAEVTGGLVPLGQLGQPELDELARQSGVRGVVDTLSQWGIPLAAALKTGMGEYAAAQDLAVLELALDRSYFAWAAAELARPGRNARVARMFVGIHADVANVLTCLRLVNDGTGGAHAERFFLPGAGLVRQRLFVRLASAESVDELIAELAHTRYGRAFDEVLERYAETGSLTVLERALEGVLFRTAYAAQRTDPLGIGLAISYLWQKANEVTNVRIVVKGVAIGMSRDVVKEALIGA